MERSAPGFAGPADGPPLDYARDLGDPGEFPYTRGARGALARSAGWTHRELSGEGSPRRSNRQLHYLLGHGARGLDVIGDAATMGLVDPDHLYARHSVGTQGVSVCRREDFFELYDGVPMGEVSVSNSMNAPFCIAGLYLTAQHNGTDPALIRGSVINAPFFMEDYGYATHLPFPVRMRMALDAIEFATTHLPRFHPFVEDTYFISDGGPGPVDEMALGFVEIRAVARALIARGLDIDSFAPRIAVLVNCRMDVFTEIAKIRATRRIFARLMRDELGARDPRSWSPNVTVHTSGASLTAQQPVNNIVRGALQAFAMAAAGVKAMEISAFDEAFRTPSGTAHLVGLRTQQIIALETEVSASADPFGGSWFIEGLTDDIEARILARVAEIEAAGDPAELFESGYFRGIFQDAMERFGREISDGSRTVVGVNAFSMPPEDDTLLKEVSEVKIRPDDEHTERIIAWKAGRDMDRVAAGLAHVNEGVRTGANTVELIIHAFEHDATVGEIAGEIRVASGLKRDPMNPGAAA
ncbi:methylmalonyl-CoA mutase family protein [Tomitella fengzijianii]|uniref:methylmalonyl-CoA mutase family protein n=1 Tax=Tomitella fengzijianii TaxID=2597660 RepID=UPI00131DC2FD|nr:methylmalonyl-CoA mutase family protein [Tomitella fengzijianii]